MSEARERMSVFKSGPGRAYLLDKYHKDEDKVGGAHTPTAR